MGVTNHLLTGMILQAFTLPETNSSPLKMDGWKISFQDGLFGGAKC